MIDSARALVGC